MIYDRPEMPEIETVPDELKLYVLGMESYAAYLEGYIEGYREYVKGEKEGWHEGQEGNQGR